jgi:hypothetical protein
MKIKNNYLMFPEYAQNKPTHFIRVEHNLRMALENPL